MASESEQLAYLREHQPALETVLVKAVGATVSARSDDPLHFLVTYLAEAIGLVVRSRPSKRLREIGFKAMVIGATVREVVGLRQWIPESSVGMQDEVGGLDPILPERYKSIARDKTFSQRVVHPAVRVAGHEAELARMLEHGTQHWEFDSLRLTVVSGGHPLLALGWSLFERHRLRDELGLTSEVVLGFLSRVETLYNHVPYHNAEHACDVTHSFHYLLMTDALRDLAASPIDMFCCLVAAICHDLNHDGRNNAFHAASDSPIARRHAYDSPLERHHLAQTFETLARPECNLLASFTPAVRRDVRDKLTALVLATDFALHKQTLDDVGYAIRGGAPPGTPPAGTPRASEPVLELGDLEPDDKLLCLKLAIKTADLSYLSKGHAYVQVWTDRVLEEFFAQGDAETALNLPVSPGFSREGHSRPHSQIGFIKFMVRPLYASLASVAPLELKPMQDNLEKLQDFYTEQVERKTSTAKVP